MDIHGFVQSAIPLLTAFGLKVIGAIVLWVIGRKLISIARKLVVRSLKYPFDQTVAAYIGTAVSVILTITLIIALLGFFGIETTSFAALLAGVGIAIGAAWSGLLANLAAGVFLLVLRPFKVGDFISAGGIVGTVDEIGLFVTNITRRTTCCTFVGNGKIFGDNIQNFTAHPYRRVDLLAQLDNSVNHAEAIRLLKAAVARIPNVGDGAAPDVEILTFTSLGPVLAVRPYCHNDHYWQVYFDTNRSIPRQAARATSPRPGSTSSSTGRGPEPRRLSRSENSERMRGRASGADQAQRGGREHELVAPFLGAGAGQPLRIRVVDEGQPEERNGQVRGHAEAGVPAGALVHHVPRDGRDVLGAEPLETGHVQAGVLRRGASSPGCRAGTSRRRCAPPPRRPAPP